MVKDVIQLFIPIKLDSIQLGYHCAEFRNKANEMLLAKYSIVYRSDAICESIMAVIYSNRL